MENIETRTEGINLGQLEIGTRVNFPLLIEAKLTPRDLIYAGKNGNGHLFIPVRESSSIKILEYKEDETIPPEGIAFSEERTCGLHLRFMGLQEYRNMMEMINQYKSNGGTR